MEKHDATCSVPDLQDHSQNTCSCDKTTPSDQESSSTTSTNATACQPGNTHVSTPSVIESASATTSSKNHTGSAPLIIFAICIAALFFAYPVVSSLARNSMAHLQEWAKISSPSKQGRPRQYRHYPYQHEETAPEDLSSILPPLFSDGSHE